MRQILVVELAVKFTVSALPTVVPLASCVPAALFRCHEVMLLPLSRRITLASVCAELHFTQMLWLEAELGVHTVLRLPSIALP